jgi:pimeloyl-ACP methyl ester carboxylesterase
VPVPLPSVPGVSSRFVDVGDLRVHVAEAGHGEPLVLLHGWPQHWYAWRAMVPRLSAQFRLVMPDLRGHGWTSAPRGGYDKEQLATDLLGLLDALGLERVGLVGHDWGGWTGFLACLRAPERFRAFLALGITHPFQSLDPGVREAHHLSYQVLLSSPVLAAQLLQRSPRLVETIIRIGTTREGAFTAEDRRLYADVLREPDRARATVALYRTFLLRETLPVLRGRYAGARLTVPARLLSGDGDPVISAGLLTGWQAAAPDLHVEVVPGCGHFLPEEVPDLVAEHVGALFGGALFGGADAGSPDRSPR